MEISDAYHCGITIPSEQPKFCLSDLQSREEDENKTKIQRGSVMRRSVSKADDLQHFILMFETSAC